jgi:hypothetical protein
LPLLGSFFRISFIEFFLNKMDPHAQVRALQVEREALKKELEAPDLRYEKAVMIYRRIAGVDSLISDYSAQISASRSVFARFLDQSLASQLGWVALTAGASYAAASLYMPVRHKAFPYTEMQVLHRAAFGIHVKGKNPMAKATFGVIAFFSLFKFLTRTNAQKP